jgi:hypothetical protein
MMNHGMTVKDYGIQSIARGRNEKDTRQESWVVGVGSEIDF